MWHGEAIDHVEQTSMEGQDMASMLKSLQQKSCIQFLYSICNSQEFVINPTMRMVCRFRLDSSAPGFSPIGVCTS